MRKKFDVLGIGNAIVDILAFVDDQFIVERSLEKGSMALMGAGEQAHILQAVENHDVKFASGGSAANTMVAIAQSGGQACYLGKVTADPNGEFYRQDMEEAGVSFPVQPAVEANLPTGTSVILTTEDAERTMCTHLGISTSLTMDDIPFDELSNCQICYVEGYLWDAEQPRAACEEVMRRAQEQDVQLAFTFSDPFLVHRFPDEFRRVADTYCNILFCNADEARSFCNRDEIERCAEEIGSLVELAFITQSEHGCLVVERGKVEKVSGFPVKPLDTVGAGDAFAGGVLYGLTNGKTPAIAARWGNYVASEIVKINGPRLPGSVSSQVAAVAS